MRIPRLLLWCSLAILSVAVLLPARKQQDVGPPTQVRPLPPTPPAVVTADSSRLVFRVAPVWTRGLLSQQVRRELKTLFKSLKRSRIVHLRAFVAGSGDMRRVQSVVGDVFSNKHLPLPSLSVVQVGPLPVPGAQVVLEAVAEDRKVRNPNGLAFISGQAVSSGEAPLLVAPLARRSLNRIRSAIGSLGLENKDVLRLTCYCSSLRDEAELHRNMTSMFPAAAATHVQLRRAYTGALVSCEAVARLKQAPGKPLTFVNPEQLGTTGGYSQVALVGPGPLAISGAQIAFRSQKSDVRLAFERLGRSLQARHASLARVAVARFYTLSPAVSNEIRALDFDYFDRRRPPAITLVEVDGLPPLDASFGMDVVAVVHR